TARRGNSPYIPCILIALTALLFPALSHCDQEQPPHVYSSVALDDGQFLNTWVVCGPFPNAKVTDNPAGGWIHDARCTGFYTDYLGSVGGEGQVVPLPGNKVEGPDGESRRWTAVSTRTGRLFLGDFMSPTTNQVAYAVCWIDCDAPKDRLVGLGSSDGVRVWVNGAEVFRVHKDRALQVDENYFRLPLTTGRNQVLLKVENGEGRWGFSLRPVDNRDALKSLIPRLKEALRFDYQTADDGYTVTWGDPTIVGNLEGLPDGRITLQTQDGETAGHLEVPLGRPFFIPFSEYTEKTYRLSGEVLWPYRGKVRGTGLLYRGDLQQELRGLLAASRPAMASSRAADAYTSVLDTVARAVRLHFFDNEPRAYLRLKEGITRALEGALVLQNSQSPYEHLFPKPKHVGTSSNEMAVLTGNWILSTADSIFDDSLDDALFTRWSKHTAAITGTNTGHVYVLALETDLLATPIPELRGDDSEFKEAAESIRDRVPEDPEGYAIQITAEQIVVAGRTAEGAHYGMDTLLQLIAQNTTLATATIIDAPEHPTRAAILPLESFDADFRDTIDELAHLRFNTVFLPSSLYPDLEDEEIQPLLKGAFAYCRARFVEPIPLVETFGAHTLAAEIDPNLLEGVYIEEVPIVVDDLRRLHLPYDRILVNESTTPGLRTSKGYKILRKDRDFVFESLAPPIIQLKGKAPVQTGATLLVTADVVDRSLASTGASCPSDTEAWILTEQVLDRIYAHLSPVGIHIGQTGAGYLNRDSRCLAREMPNALLLADAVQKSYDIVRNFDKKARIYMWGDHFSPLQQARSLDAMRAAEYLPKDITVLDGWHHGASDYDTWRVEQGIRFFDQYGLKTLGVVQDDPLNTQQVATLKRRFPRRFRGIVHRFGNAPDDGRYLAAEAGWQGVTALGTPSAD
ncbi:MAG: glycoside hydrolase family 20 zincin-like fold domain-containing protein, partial [Candidatus Hydrogenedentes bacterium]|nr:glycoside hydrolase family 20 zincin-like fold domain-containing protein [Candidatus Hydrogenedentota bacterium]